MNRVIIKTFYSDLDVNDFLEVFYHEAIHDQLTVQKDYLSSGAIRVAVMIFDPELQLEKSVG